MRALLDLGDHVGVPLSQGQIALVDREDVRVIQPYTWSLHSEGYAVTKSGTVYMHRLVLPEAAEVDHWNGDGLDNRRANLRCAARLQNGANQRRLRTKKNSRFKGVRWNGRSWTAQISIAYKAVHLGSFGSEESAALAYDAAAVEAWGEFAATNAGMGLLAPFGREED